MSRNRLTLDLAQCEVFKHLTAWKAGVLIKAVVNYWMTGEVAPWGEDADLKPMFLTIRATMEMQREEEEEKIRKEKIRNRTNYLKRKGNSTNSTRLNSLNSLKESERERDGDEEKRSKREEEEEKAKVKERKKETLHTKKNETEETKQTELFEREAQEESQKPEAKRADKEGEAKPTPRFQKPSVADIAEYVKAKGYEQWVDPEAFWSYHENRDWTVGNHKMKSWHLAITTWMRNNKTRQQQPRRGNGTSVGERAYNMLHFEYEGHPEMWKEEEKKFAELQKAFR